MKRKKNMRAWRHIKENETASLYNNYLLSYDSAFVLEIAIT